MFGHFIVYFFVPTSKRRRQNLIRKVFPSPTSLAHLKRLERHESGENQAAGIVCQALNRALKPQVFLPQQLAAHVKVEMCQPRLIRLITQERHASVFEMYCNIMSQRFSSPVHKKGLRSQAGKPKGRCPWLVLFKPSLF